LATFGQTTQGDTPATYGEIKVVSRFTLAVPGTVTKLTVDCDNPNASAQVLKGLIYADGVGNDPDALEAVSDEVSVAAAAARAWVDLALTTPVTLPAGEHHLGLHLGNVGDQIRIYHRSTGNGRKRNSDLYADGPSDPFGALSSADSFEVAIYATFDPLPVLPISCAHVGRFGPF
jgi:hypothetical protein